MLYFLNKEFWFSPLLVVLFLSTLFVIVLLRYLLLASTYQFIINKYYNIKNNNDGKRRKQFLRELGWSTISSLIFTGLGAFMYWLYQHGYTKVYTDINDYSLAYFIGSILLMVILYETYYYWLHRWMHHPKVFKIVHKVHHESISTSVFTSFSFHPLESILQFILLPILILIIPVHYYALVIVLILMTISAIINHAGKEIFPRNAYRHPVLKWFIGSTHHDLHHAEFKTNFGLYFTCWDKWMKTESKRYEEKFIENKG